MPTQIDSFTLRQFITGLRTLPLGMYDTVREIAVAEGVPAALAAMRRRVRAAATLGLDASQLSAVYHATYRAWASPETY
jgi:hypothetical protein